MSPITGDLMQIAILTNFFLDLSDDVKLTPEQRKTLGDIYFEIERYTVRRKADLDVVDAELRRLTSSDQVDISAVRVKVKEVESIQAEATITKIEAALRAINVLTHEQHLQVMLLIQQKQNQQQQMPNG